MRDVAFTEPVRFATRLTRGLRAALLFFGRAFGDVVLTVVGVVVRPLRFVLLLAICGFVGAGAIFISHHDWPDAAKAILPLVLCIVLRGGLAWLDQPRAVLLILPRW
jgi:hypothetical protein